MWGKKMKIESFNRENLKNMRKEINQALTALGDKYGVMFEIGNIRFSDHNFRTQLSVTVSNPNLEIQGAKANDFNRYCGIYGLVPSDLGKTFKGLTGETYKLVGLKSKSTKYPFVGERADGKKFKFTAEQVRKELGKK